jgi:hypothetical protein
MSEIRNTASRDWLASVYFASADVRCPIATAWKILLDYRAWNPHFHGVDVTPIRGTPGTEGELVVIKDAVSYVEGEPPPEFYAETVKVQPPHRVVWCVFSKAGPAFRNFVDFGLTETNDGVKFNVGYYEQVQLTPDKLSAHRAASDEVYAKLVAAFRTYAESSA